MSCNLKTRIFVLLIQILRVKLSKAYIKKYGLPCKLIKQTTCLAQSTTSYRTLRTENLSCLRSVFLFKSFEFFMKDK